MKAIELTKGFLALVDDADFDRVNAFKWTALVTGKYIQRVYAYRREDWNQERRVWRRQVLMHRFITDAPDGSDVDHVNSETLDNRRSNLRVCTRGQNLAGTRRTNQNGYRGVAKDGNVYFAQISINGKRLYRRGFRTPGDAAQAYDEMAREYHGEFARLNFPAVSKEI